MAKPKWSTPHRKAYLVKLFLDSQGFCIFGHKSCQIPEHHYSVHIERLIQDWIADDRSQSIAEWQAEQKALHALGETKEPIRGRFSNISRDIIISRQPPYYLEGLGISGLTFTPFAKVRVASSYVYLYIDLGNSLKSLSKNRRRKVIRYGMALPKRTADTIDLVINRAIKHYNRY